MYAHRPGNCRLCDERRAEKGWVEPAEYADDLKPSNPCYSGGALATPFNKPTNPKDAVGIAKAPASCVPRGVMQAVGVAMMEGALKYGRHNYRTAGVRASVYFDATNRHLDSFWEGEDIDPVSNLPHLIKAIASLTVLADSIMSGNWVDDRPPPLKPGWLDDLNARAAALLEKFPNPPPAAIAARAA